ncbi:MAG: hypothetical protein H6Q04_1536 [Acidobacteria bacterium]|nr:hypothetical protein [Acidobacteriota bacterium]
MRLAWIPTLLIFMNNMFAQTSLPNNATYKDLIFPQLAAGGQYETWITVHNPSERGVWSGTFNFFHNKGEIWNPVVNDVEISDGKIDVTLQRRETRTYKITLPGDVASGFMMATAANDYTNNFIEGNLTYYVKNGGVITDSVGVLPSRPFYVASLPFEDFGTIAYAITNTGLGPHNVMFRIFSDADIQQSTSKAVSFAAMEHKAQYLYELFPDIPRDFGRGRLEIECTGYTPISGMALMFMPGSQMSSLPLGSEIIKYELDESGTDIDFGNLTLWAEGPFINGYIDLVRGTSPTAYPVFGHIRDNRVVLHFDRQSNESGDKEIFGYLVFDTIYMPPQSHFSGDYYIATPSEGQIQQGRFDAYLFR